MDGCGIGRYQHVEFAKGVGHRSAVEDGGELAIDRIDALDVADIAIIDLLVVIVLDLHDLVTRGKGPAKALDLCIAGRVQRRLQFDIERARADAAPVHRTKNLDIADGSEAEAFWNPSFHELDDARHGGFGVIRLYEIEVTIGTGGDEIRDGALVDAMGANDDPALRGLPKHLGQA